MLQGLVLCLPILTPTFELSAAYSDSTALLKDMLGAAKGKDTDIAYVEEVMQLESFYEVSDTQLQDLVKVSGVLLMCVFVSAVYCLIL